MNFEASSQRMDYKLYGEHSTKFRGVTSFIKSIPDMTLTAVWTKNMFDMVDWCMIVHRDEKLCAKLKLELNTRRVNLLKVVLAIATHGVLGTGVKSPRHHRSQTTFDIITKEVSPWWVTDIKTLRPLPMKEPIKFEEALYVEVLMPLTSDGVVNIKFIIYSKWLLSGAWKRRQYNGMTTGVGVSSVLSKEG